MLEPSHLVEGYLLFSQDLADVVTYSLSNFAVGDQMHYADIAQQTKPCFTAGTWIAPPSGAKRVETLRISDPVCTLHHGQQSIRCIGKRSIKVAPNFPKINFDLSKFLKMPWDRVCPASPCAYPANIDFWCHPPLVSACLERKTV